MSTDDSEEHIASIFKVEEEAKHETSVKQVASTYLMVCVS
jgi:hypothetical protein